MANFIKLKPYRINKQYDKESVYININMICAIFPTDDDFTQINLVNEDQIVVNMNVDKLIENIRND